MALTQFGFANGINSKVNGLLVKAINPAMNTILKYCSTLRRFNTLQDISIGLPDPFKSYQWEAYFPSIAIDNGTGAGVKAVTYTPILEDITMTFPEISVKSLDYSKRKINVPDEYNTNGSVTCKFYCDNRLQIVNYFNTWRNLVRDDYGLYGYPNDYKKEAFIYALGMKSIVPVYVFKIRGMFPQRLSQITLESSNSAKRVTATITFSYDDFDYEPVRLGQMAATYLDGNIAGIMANQAQASGLQYLHQNFVADKGQNAIVNSVSGLFGSGSK